MQSLFRGRDRDRAVYNLSVAGPENYFAEEVLVHNKDGPPTPPPEYPPCPECPPGPPGLPGEGLKCPCCRDFGCPHGLKGSTVGFSPLGPLQALDNLLARLAAFCPWQEMCFCGCYLLDHGGDPVTGWWHRGTVCCVPCSSSYEGESLGSEESAVSESLDRKSVV